MENVIKTAILECHYSFPDYGRKTEDLQIIVKIFTKHFSDAGLSKEDIRAGFDHHIRTASGKEARFPTPGDIISAVQPVTCYRLDYGPLGFGGVYHADHPYVRAMMRTNQNLAGYDVAVRRCDAGGLLLSAQMDPEIPATENDDEPQILSRGNSGFRQISFAN